MESTTEPKRLLRASEVAQMIGVDPATVRELVATGALRSVRLGGQGWHRFRRRRRAADRWRGEVPVNEERRPSRRLPDNWNAACEPSVRPGDRRAWARQVRQLSDDELIQCVRAQVAVDHAVDTYRASAAAPIHFDVPA